jgi:RHH-type proline utilization regulon transcriptional repressor/proline dehydrogenase/delta 1-pyrroline-5-carboxylate dehydrogenase
VRAQRLFAAPDSFYPQFATHNAHTVAAVLEMVPAGCDFELQRLHGMGEALYRQVKCGPPMCPLLRSI